MNKLRRMNSKGEKCKDPISLPLVVYLKSFLSFHAKKNVITMRRVLSWEVEQVEFEQTKTSPG